VKPIITGGAAQKTTRTMPAMTARTRLAMVAPLEDDPGPSTIRPAIVCYETR